MEKKDVDKIIEWIKELFGSNPYAKGAILGMSGGKDSLVVAKLCIEALGKDRVFGVILPNGEMKDISDATKTCDLLQIPYTVINIEESFNSILTLSNTALKNFDKSVTDDSKVNLAPRLRMSTIYLLAQSMGYFVANTSNLSEISVGYSTKWGDGVGDFAPIANFTKSEVCEIGHLLGLPKELVDKTPADGLTSMTDEEKMQITYSELDSLIRTGEKPTCYEKIMKLNKSSEHKRKGVTKYTNNLKNYLN